MLQQEDGIANLEVLPEGDYLCQQKPAQALDHMDTLISEYFVQHPKANQVMITNLTSAYFDLKGPSLELQEPI